MAQRGYPDNSFNHFLDEGGSISDNFSTSSVGVGFFGKAPQAQPSAITDASTAHALNAVFSDTEAEAALNALGTKVNSILTVLRDTGLIAT